MNEVALISFGELQGMASTMSKSGLFNKTPEQMLSLMLIAQAEGIHPAIAAMEYDIIQNRPALKGQAALARFQQSGGRIDWIVRTDSEAKATFSHPQGGSLTVSWDKAKATKAGLWDKRGSNGSETPWQKMPGVMLSWRCVAEGVRAVYPACLNRMYLAEEVQDFEPMKNVSPQIEPEAIIQPAGIDYKSLAAELTAKAGLSKDEKAAMFNDCGKNVKVYCEKLEAILAMVPTGEPEFALNSTPPEVKLFDIISALEEYERSDSTPAAAKGDIQNAFARGETDIKKLSDLLNRVKTACK